MDHRARQGLVRGRRLCLRRGELGLEAAVLAPAVEERACRGQERDPVSLTLWGFGFAALLFFVVCYGISQYSQWLERRLATDHR